MNKTLLIVTGSLMGWAAWTVSLVWGLHALFPGKEGDSFAAWAQAVGSIGAVFAVFVVAWRQSQQTLESVRNAQREKRHSILAIAEAAATHASRFGKALGREDAKVGVYSIYDKAIIKGVVEALTDAPAHEVGSRDGVLAFLEIRARFGWLGAAIEKFLAPLESDLDYKRLLDSCGTIDPAQSQ